jgi:hypothetical protein
MSVTAATQAAVAAQRFPVAIARETVLLQVRGQRMQDQAMSVSVSVSVGIRGHEMVVRRVSSEGIFL